MKQFFSLVVLAWFLLEVCVFAVPVMAQSQLPLTKKESENISYLARERLNLLNQLMNGLTDQDLDEYGKDYMIKSSYAPINMNQVFYNDLVTIEDDIDPNHTSPTDAEDVPVDRYLNDLSLFYAKTSMPNTIVFSKQFFFPVQQNGSLLYIKGFFTSTFKGSHIKMDKPYQPTSRVVEMRADKVDNKWQVRITRVDFARPGEGMSSSVPLSAPATTGIATATTNGRPTIPANLSINSTEVQYRQPETGTIFTVKVNRNWLEVTQSGAGDVPLGFYQRREQLYVYDNLTTIELLDNSNRLIFHKELQFTGYERVSHIASLKTDSAAKPLIPLTDARPLARPDTARPAGVVRVLTPANTDKPKVSNTETRMSPRTAADSATALTVRTLVPKTSKRQQQQPVASVPATGTLPPALTNSLTAEARQRKAYYRTAGWLQIMAGVAGLAGSYLAYASIKKDYDGYTAKVDKLNADYANWLAIARQPGGSPLTPMALTSYGSPGIYGVYGGGGISIGLVINGIRSLGKAGKVKAKKQ